MNRCTRSTHTAFAVIALLLAVVLGLGLSGCQKAPEDVIREGVTTELEGIKTFDDATVADIVSGMETSGSFEQYGIDSEEFCRVWLDGFDYQLGDVSVTGSDASVTLDLTCKSFSAALEDFEQRVTNFSEDPAAREMDSDEINAKVGELLMESMAAAPLSTTSVSLPYTLDGNIWVPSSGFYPAFLQALMGGTA